MWFGLVLGQHLWLSRLAWKCQRNLSAIYIRRNQNSILCSIKRTGSLNYFEGFYHPDCFFHVLNEIFLPPCSFFHVLKNFFAPPCSLITSCSLNRYYRVVDRIPIKGLQIMPTSHACLTKIFDRMYLVLYHVCFFLFRVNFMPYIST